MIMISSIFVELNFSNLRLLLVKNFYLEETLFYAESRGIIKIYLLPLSEFILLYQKEIRIAHWVAEQLNKLLFSSYEDIISQSFLKLNDRIVKLTNSREAYSKNLRLSHQQIADELGTSREVVTRNLKKIRKKISFNL